MPPILPGVIRDNRLKSQSSLRGVHPLSTWQTIDTHGKFGGIANNATSAHNATGGMKLIAKKVPQPISAEGWIKNTQVHSGSCLIYRFRSIMSSAKQIFQVPLRKITIQLSSPRLHLNISPPMLTPNSTIPLHKRTSSHIHTHMHACAHTQSLSHTHTYTCTLPILHGEEDLCIKWLLHCELCHFCISLHFIPL